MKKLLSVIIPVYNDEKHLEKCLTSVFNSDYSKYEVIVVNGASTDNSLMIAKKFPCRIIDQKENLGVSDSRNKGAEAAKGEILVFFDSDIVIEKDTLSKFAKAHEDPEVKICESQVYPKSLNPGFAADLLAAMWNYQLKEMMPHPTFISTMSFSIDKNVFFEIGKFNTQFGTPQGGGGEEFEIGIAVKQHNYKIFLNPLIKVYHHFQNFWPRIKTLYKRSYVYGKFTFQRNFQLDRGAATASHGISSLLSIVSILFLGISLLIPFVFLLFLMCVLAQIFLNFKLYKHIKEIHGSAFSFKSIFLIYFWYLSMGLGISKAAAIYSWEKIISPLHKVSFFFSKTPPHVIFYVTSRCNARCKHCFFWKNKHYSKIKELSFGEIKKISKSFDKIKYLSCTGGEPSLREDIAEVIQTFYKNNKLEILNYITNGFATDKIINDIKRILRYCPNIRLLMHVSIDNIGKQHDAIRNVPGGFNKLSKTIKEIKKLQKDYPQLYLGTITTYSKFNKDNIFDVVQHITEELKLPVYVNYVRGETYNKEAKDVDLDTYVKISKLVATKNRNLLKKRIPNILKATEHLAPKLVTKILKEKRNIMPCVVGKRVIEIGHDGAIFPCEMLATNFGNIRDFDYDIKKVLKSEKAKAFFKFLKGGKCYCTWECAIRNNMLYNPLLYPALFLEWVRLLTK